MHIIRNARRKVMKTQVTKLSLLLILLDSPEKVLQLLRSLLIKGWPSLWQWVGQQEVSSMCKYILHCVCKSSMCKYIYIDVYYMYITHFKLFLAVVLGLQESKENAGFPCNLHLTLSNSSILCNCDTFIQNKKSNVHI